MLSAEHDIKRPSPHVKDLHAVRLRILGTGNVVPATVVSNTQLCKLLGDYSRAWTPNAVVERTGIRERRQLFALGERNGASATPDTDLAFEAASRALSAAGIPASDVESLIHITCTPDFVHFSASAGELHKRLGLRQTCIPFQMDAGCGGTVTALHMAGLFMNGGCSCVLIVASNTPSAFFSDSGYSRYLETLPGSPYSAALSALMFGDGAGAVVVSRSNIDNGHDVLASVAGIDTAMSLMHYQGGGASIPTHARSIALHRYEIDAKAVAVQFRRLLKRAIEELQAIHPFELATIRRFYFHQANLRLIERFAEDLDIAMTRVAVNVDRYGNTSAASTLILLDDDVRQGAVHEGDLLLIAAMGAGAQYGATLVRW
jgi:3-oxoacyl-[acyl-carrier-protein] synthase-3